MIQQPSCRTTVYSTPSTYRTKVHAKDHLARCCTCGRILRTKPDRSIVAHVDRILVRNQELHAVIPTRMSSISSNKAPEPVGHYPHARRVGDLLFLSGVGPRERGTKKIPGVELNADGTIASYDIETQVRSVFQNVRWILEDSGSSWEKIVDVTVFLTNMKDDFATYNRLWKEYFETDPPCRTTLEINCLPTPIAIELKVVATL